MRWLTSLPPCCRALAPCPSPQHERFTLPSGQEVEAEARAPPDLEVVRRRLKETVTVLDNFAAARAPGRSRADYMDQVRVRYIFVCV